MGQPAEINRQDWARNLRLALMIEVASGKELVTALVAELANPETQNEEVLWALCRLSQLNVPTARDAFRECTLEFSDLWEKELLSCNELFVQVIAAAETVWVMGIDEHCKRLRELCEKELKRRGIPEELWRPKLN